MNTFQHVAIYAMAMMEKASSTKKFEMRMVKGMPWFLLPNSIRYYGFSRQVSHFEETPDATDVAWIEFPREEVLREFTKKDVLTAIRYHVKKKYQRGLIGEKIRLDIFDRHNYAHRNYNEMRLHLMQDSIYETFLKQELVDVTGRFKDRFVLQHNRKEVLNGGQLQRELNFFENYGFLHLVKRIEEKTEVLLNQEWFDTHIYDSLKDSCYPKRLTEMYSCMRIPEEIEIRINHRDFSIQGEIFGISGEELIDIFDELYSRLYLSTVREI